MMLTRICGPLAEKQCCIRQTCIFYGYLKLSFKTFLSQVNILQGTLENIFMPLSNVGLKMN
jgi:hypothetical protein